MPKGRLSRVDFPPLHVPGVASLIHHWQRQEQIDPMERFELRLFQQFAFLIDATLDGSLSSPRMHALLAWLILHRQGPQPRERLAQALWPDTPDAQARTNLRNLLFRLRSIAPAVDAQIVTRDSSLQWAPTLPFAVDVVTFERAAESLAVGLEPDLRASLSVALAAYSGPLLPTCKDEWLEPHRQRLAQMYEQLLTQGISLYEQARDTDSAIRLAQRLLECNPLREDAYRSLMRLHAVTGDRASALSIYRQCAETLEQELGVYPSDSTREIARRLRKETPAAVRPPTAPLKLVGRKAEWAQLQALWRKASDGQLSMAVLEGQSGTGKTRLAEEMLAWAQHQSIATSFAKGFPTSRQLAYGTTVSLLKSCPLESLPPVWQLELCPLLPERLTPKQSPPPERHEPFMRHRLLEAITRGICLQQPRLVVIDDAQWCDPDSLDWLSSLASSAPEARVMVLFTLCIEELAPDHPISDLLHALQRAGRLVRIPVGPLSPEEGQQLADLASVQGLKSERARWVLERSGGNPLLLIELIKAGLTPGMEVGDDHLPTTIQSVFERRLHRLSPAARTVAELAAVMGDNCSIHRLDALAALEPEILSTGTEELWGRAILLEDNQGRLTFSHGLFADFIYRHISTLRRRSRHLQVADSLARQSKKTLAEQIEQGRHLERGGRMEQAFQAYVKAGEQAMSVFAYERAQHCFQHALTLLSPIIPLEDHWAALSGLELSNQALGHQPPWDETLVAMQAFTAMVGNRHPQASAWRADTHTRISRQKRLCGDSAAALHHAELATQHATLSGDIRLQANAWNEHAFAVLQDSGNLAETYVHLTRALAFSIQLQDGAMQGQLMARTAWALHGLGRVDEADKTIREALVITRNGGQESEIARALLHLSRIAQTRQRGQDAEEALLEAQMLATRCGDTALLSAVHSELGQVYNRFQKFYSALNHFREALHHLKPYPYDWVRAEYCLQVSVTVMALGRPSLAMRLFDRARAFRGESVQLHVLQPMHSGQAWCAAIFGYWSDVVALMRLPDVALQVTRQSASNNSEWNIVALHALLALREGQVPESVETFELALEQLIESERVQDPRDLKVVFLDCLESVGSHPHARAVALRVALALANQLTENPAGMLRPAHACLQVSKVLEREGHLELARRLLELHRTLEAQAQAQARSRDVDLELRAVEEAFLGG